MVQLSSFSPNHIFQDMGDDLQFDQFANLGKILKPLHLAGSTVLEYVTDHPEAISDVKQLIPEFILDTTGMIKQLQSVLPSELLASVSKQLLPWLDKSPISLSSAMSSIDLSQVVAQVVQDLAPTLPGPHRSGNGAC
jgi:hypothetical protein